MHFTLILLALFISLAVGDVNPSKFTYWLDPESCTGKRDMSDIVKETKQMGERAAARLDSVTDTDYQRVYEFLMKRPKSDQENLRKIRNFMYDVSTMTEEKNHDSSNVRIYCDNEKRWAKRTDPVTQMWVGGWIDNANGIFYPGITKESLPGCLDTKGGERFTHAQSYREEMVNPPKGQAEKRMTTTICELDFFKAENPDNPWKLLKDVAQDTDLSKAPNGVESFRYQPSKVLLHELSHYHGYDTLDHAYFLEKIHPRALSLRELDANTLMETADIWSYVGQMALIADRGYIFERPPPQPASEKEMNDYRARLEQFKLYMYPQITRRSLQGRAEPLPGGHIRILQRSGKPHFDY